MKLRTKWKRAKKEAENQKAIIEGLERRNKYLCSLCESRDREIAGLRQTKNLLRMLLEGAALEAGSITIHTEGLQKRIDQCRINYDIDAEGHKIRLSAEEK